MLGRIYSHLRVALQSPTRSLSVTRARTFRPGMEYLEDRTVPSTNTINVTGAGAYGTSSDGNVTMHHVNMDPTGSGVIDPFLRIHHQNFEQGYNTSWRQTGNDVELLDDIQNLGFTHDIKLANVLKVNIGGTDYRVFRLDLGEPGNDTSTSGLVNFGQLMFFTSPTGQAHLTGNTWPGSIPGTTLRYSLDGAGDNDFTLRDLTSGNGALDYEMFVKDSVFASAGPNDYLYMYSSFGSPPPTADGTFEEWSYLPNPGIVFTPPTIGGHKFEDSDGNLATNGDQSGVEGWTININDGNNTVTVTTGAGGAWNHTFNAPGTYTITEGAGPWSSWTQLGTTSYTVTVDAEGNVSDSAGSSTANDFFNFRNMTISGMKFEDHNGNGQIDGTDATSGLGGWHILVDGVDSATTAADGTWSVSNVGPGTHTIQEVNQVGWTHTYQVNGYSVTPSSGIDIGGNNFGNFKNFSLSGTKYEDITGDGFSTDDPVLDNANSHYVSITVNLYKNGGATPFATITTGTNGSYSFTNLGPGTYSVSEVVPTGWTKTAETGNTIVAASGINSTGNNFDNFKNVVISGYKFYDANTNGDFDGVANGEGKIPNWFITLYKDVNNNGELDGGDTIAQVTTTNSAGNYAFSVAYAGKFLIVESTTPPTGFTTTGWVPTRDVVQSTDALFSGGSGSAIFGNVELGKGGGLTLGFWSNKNGKAAMTNGPGGMAGALAYLSGLNLRTATGADFNPTNYDQFRSWILGATATNMANMLSAQMAAMQLNVRQGFVNGGSLIYAPGTNSANLNGFASVNAVMNEANTELGTHGTAMSADSWRAYQEKLKNALDNANNNLTFVLLWHDTNNNGVVDPGEIY